MKNFDLLIMQVIKYFFSGMIWMHLKFDTDTVPEDVDFAFS